MDVEYYTVITRINIGEARLGCGMSRYDFTFILLSQTPRLLYTSAEHLLYMYICT